MIHPEHFCADLTSAQAAELFKKSVRSVEISISSYCNRRCPYCPNSKADRISQRNFMSDDLFLSVMRQLCRIDYANEIALNRFNEPLADRDYAMKRIREIRAFLPKAKITVFTNGDYLDASYVRELGAAGVSWVMATMHEPPGGATYAEVVEAQERFIQRIGLPHTVVSDEPEVARLVYLQTGTAMGFSLWARNFHRRDSDGVLWMQDRGQSMPVDKGMLRTTPCYIPFVQLQIEWDGELLPCCQIQPDVFAKGQYTLGRLTAASDIFLEWTNRNYLQWRNELFSYEAKKAPCATCNYGGMAVETPALREMVADWRRTLQLDRHKAEALCA